MRDKYRSFKNPEYIIEHNNSVIIFTQCLFLQLFLTHESASPVQHCDHIVRFFSLNHDPAIALSNKPTLDSFVHPLQQAVPVAINIKHHDASLVKAQLIPRRRLHQLLQRPISAAQRHEPTSRPTFNDFARHHLLARVHVRDSGQAAECLLADDFAGSTFGAVFAVEVALQFHKLFGDDAVYSFGAGERDKSFGQLAHHARRAAAVDEVHVVLVQGSGEGAGGREVGWACAWRGATAVGRLLVKRILGTEVKVLFCLQDADNCWFI